MSDASRCQKCGAPVATASSSICAECQLALGIETEPVSPIEKPAIIQPIRHPAWLIRRLIRLAPLVMASVAVAIIYGQWVLPGIRRIWPEVRANWYARVTRPRPPRNSWRTAPPAQTAPRLGTFTAEGPQFTPGDALSLGLPPEDLPLLNAILKVAYQEYFEIERQNSEQQPNEAGHIVTMIKPFPEQFRQFEDRVWSKLGRILDEQQHARARHELLLRFAKSSGNMPGFFGWAGEEVTIETWRDGPTYHWTIHVQGISRAESGLQPPVDLQRFWDSPQEQ